MFAFLPVAFVPIEELVPIALVHDNRVSFTAVLVPVVVLFSVSVPLLSPVYDPEASFRLRALGTRHIGFGYWAMICAMRDFLASMFVNSSVEKIYGTTASSHSIFEKV